MDDEKIIGLYFERNEKAIDETDKKYGKLCFGIAHNILRNTEDSEECVNDTYLALWNRIPPVRPNNFKAFVSGITRNLSLGKFEFIHAKKRSPDVVLSFSELEEVLPDKNSSLNMECEELGRIISDFLKAETAENRNVFIRRYYFFDSVSDIAGRFSFSESKVKSMLSRERKRLKKHLEKEGVTI